MDDVGQPEPDAVRTLATLLDLSRRTRHATSDRELGFLLANDSHLLAPYRQAAVWLESDGLYTLSGLVQIEANAPYALWLEQVCRYLAEKSTAPTQALTAADLPEELAISWAEWWPANALWLSMPAENEHGSVNAALMLVRDQPWLPETSTVLSEWTDIWWHAFSALRRPRMSSWRTFMKLLRTQLLPQPGRRWWQQRTWRWIALLITVMLIPVRQTVMAVGELVPAHPAVIRAPLDGVVDVFHVQPNQMVSKNQPLFGFDEALIQSHLDVARQALATTETDYRQTSQQALNDARFRPQLAMLSGKIEEKRAEVDFLAEQLTRARVLAPQDGVAMFDDPTEWIGRPVVVGERIMRIASAQDTEVEAWLPLADAIALPSGAPVNLYLHASPLMAVSAKLRYMAHDAVQRSDGSFAYRVRATLDSPTDHRVGLKGTAKLHGGWVPLVYWMLRRPLASVRSALGV
jgi:hypothetical protein